MKRLLLALALLAPLASCSKKDDPSASTATQPSAQSSLLLGSWNYETARIQTKHDDNAALNTDVTNTIANRQMVFSADGTVVDIAQGYRYPGTYTLVGTTLTLNGISGVSQMTELSASRLVLVRTADTGPKTHETVTSTYTR